MMHYGSNGIESNTYYKTSSLPTKNTAKNEENKQQNEPEPKDTNSQPPTISNEENKDSIIKKEDPNDINNDKQQEDNKNDSLPNPDDINKNMPDLADKNGKNDENGRNEKKEDQPHLSQVLNFGLQ
jgi:hypothetical protein